MFAKFSTKARELEPELFIPYTRHVTDTIIGLRSGAMMSVFKIDGLSFETRDAAELNNWVEAMNVFFRSVVDERLLFWTHIIRSRDQFYPHGRFRSQFSEKLDQDYAERMAGEQLYRNDLFLTVLWRPDIDVISKIEELMAFVQRRPKKTSLQQEDTVEKINQLSIEILTRFEALGVRQLSLEERRGLMFSEPMEFLHRIISGSWRELPLVSGVMASALYTDRLIFGRETIEVREPGQTKFIGGFGFKEYPDRTKPGMLNDILAAPFEFVLSQSFGLVGKSVARDMLTRKQNMMISSQDRAFSQTAQLSQALDDLESNAFVMGEHHFAIYIAAFSIKNLQEYMAKARNMLASGGAVLAREDLAIEDGFWGQLPGNTNRRARSGLITSRNFSALSCFHTHSQGQRHNNHWGDATALLKTRSGSSYYFNFHVHDLGHTFICGPSGSGKTAIMNFLLSQAEKHDPQIVLFDKDRGSEIFIRALGGSYLTLKNGRPTGCVPLKALRVEDENDRAFLSSWLKKLVVRSNYELTPDEERQLENALIGLADLPIHQRTLTAVYSALDSTVIDGVAARLHRWVRGQALGWVFDEPDDTIGMDNRVLGFDMTDFLGNAEIRTPLMMYLFLRVERLIDGRKIIIAIDEFWKALGDDAFLDLAQNKLKTFRKQNGVMVFATQSPADALNSPIAHTIIEQCATQIHFANLRGERSDYVDGFGLSDREFDLLSHEMEPKQREFIVKQDHQSAVCRLDLRGFDDALKVLSGRTSNIDVMDEIIASYGSDPDRWLPEFYRRSGSQ